MYLEGYGGFWLPCWKGNAVFGTQTLWVAPLSNGTWEDVKIGTLPSFCVHEGDKDQIFYGLEEFLLFYWEWVPVYLFDNHNHALYFWYRELKKWTFSKGIKLIHIDQHSDLGENWCVIEDEWLDSISLFVNEHCNVGNFIKPALASGLFVSCDQIRTEVGLFDYIPPEGDYVLDLDLDFWDEAMGIERFDLSFEKVRSLIRSAKILTIATSPYFLDPQRAIALLRKIFS